MSKKNDNQDFTTGSIPGKMIRFMFPILGALILQAMYSAVDLLIVGRFGKAADISGVSTGSNVMNLFTFFTCSLSAGVTILVGRYLGEKREDRIGRLLGGAVAFFFALSVLFSVIMFSFAMPIARLMQAPKEALALTVTYIRICAVGFVFVVFYNFISAIMRGLGDSSLPLVFVAIACVVNIIGDLVLVAGLGLGVAGAAFATIFAQALSVVMSVVIILKKKLPYKITRSDLIFNAEIKTAVLIGLPLGFQEILTNGTFLALCAFINHMSLECSSGYGVAQKLQSFVMLIPSAIMQSLASFVAQNVGAGKERRGVHALRYSCLMGGGIGIFIGLGIFFFGDVVAAFFSDDAAVVQRAFEFLRGFAPEAVVTCILFSYMGYFNAHAQSVFVMVQGILQSLVVRLPMSYFMSIKPDASLTGVGLAAPTATVFGIAMCIGYYIFLRKTKKIVMVDQ